MVVCQRASGMISWTISWKHLYEELHGVQRGAQPDLFLRKGVPFTYQLDHNPFLTLSTSCMHITLQIGLLIWQLLCNVGVCCCVKQWQAALSQHPETGRVECQKYNWQHCFCKIFRDKRLFTGCSCGKKRDKRQLVLVESIKQGFVCLSKERPDPFLSDCPLLCVMVSGAFSLVEECRLRLLYLLISKLQIWTVDWSKEEKHRCILAFYEPSNIADMKKLHWFGMLSSLFSRCCLWWMKPHLPPRPPLRCLTWSRSQRLIKRCSLTGSSVDGLMTTPLGFPSAERTLTNCKMPATLVAMYL